MITLQALNAASVAEFVALLDGIFEHSPWVAEHAAEMRPFASRYALHEALTHAALSASHELQLALLRAHPELAGKAAIRGELTPDSTREQAGAGLTACSPEEYAQLQQLNADYNARFGFPFIIAVKGHDRAAILRAFEQRLHHPVETELRAALHEVGRIAAFRLADRVIEPYGDEIFAMTERLARHSEHGEELTCTYLSPAHQATAKLLRDWMLQAGMTAEIDAIGNVVGRLRGSAPDAKTLLTGSHYDTVINGGRYDGRLGILLPIVVLRQLRLRGIRLPFDVEVIAFSEEEGVRFKSTFLGSSAIAGDFDLALLDKCDADGVSLREALRLAGLDAEAIPTLARDPKQLLGYVEVHIEQGPVLLEENLALGVVTAIAGSLRYLVTLTGVAGHAGTVPMHLRRDAAAAAAEIVLYVERRCAQAPGLVGTVGKLDVPHGAVNVIPGRCEFSLDIRAPDDASRDAAAADVLAAIAEISARRNVRAGIVKIVHADATPCAPPLQQRLDRAIRAVTGATQSRYLPSGAGHDAMKLASITDVGMLFVRCGAGGISHNPAETMDVADADLAAHVFADFLENYSQAL